MKTPREHFTRTADEEFSKFDREEAALRQATQRERAVQLRLPLDLRAPKADLMPHGGDKQVSRTRRENR
jgi:hypothetical protein